MKSTLAIVLCGLLMGCGHQMRMPPEQLRCISPSEIAHCRYGYSKVELKPIKGSSVRLGSRMMFEDDHYAAISCRIQEVQEPTGDVTGAKGVAVWDLLTGDLRTWVQPSTPFPEEVSEDPEPVGIFSSLDRLVTTREGHLDVWALSTSQKLASIKYSTESPFTRLERKENGWSYDRRSSPVARKVILSEDGTTLSAWVSNREALVTWSIAESKELSVGPHVDSPERQLGASCSDLHLDKRFVLHRAQTATRLFREGEFISRPGPIVFSSDCSLVAIRFERPMYFFDLDPDLTPSHTRIFDTLTGELISWISDPDGRVQAFFPSSSDLVVSTKEDLIVYDSRARVEVGRVPFPRFGSVRPFGDGCSMLVWSGHTAEVWRLGRETGQGQAGTE